MLFKLILDSRIDLDFSLERIQTASQIDSMEESFTTALLEARTTAVPKTVPFRYSLVLTPGIKALIARKNTLRRIAQRTKNSGDKRNYEALNSIVKDACQELRIKTLVKNLAQSSQIISCYLTLQNLLKTKVEASLHSKLMESLFSQDPKRLN
jgi:hypothetical protein